MILSSFFLSIDQLKLAADYVLIYSSENFYQNDLSNDYSKKLLTSWTEKGGILKNFTSLVGYTKVILYITYSLIESILQRLFLYVCRTIITREVLRSFIRSY